MGSGEKKEYRNLEGKPVIVRAVLSFIECGLFNKIVIIVPQSHIKRAGRLIGSFYNPKQFIIIEGGSTRQESVFLGLKALEKKPPEYVLIHDGARPWIDKETIRRVLEGSREYNAWLPVIASRDALKTVSSRGFISKHLSRDKVFCAQTPQGFLYNEILKAHKLAGADNKTFIDDGFIYGEYIGKVYTVPGDIKNKKITYLQDLKM